LRRAIRLAETESVSVSEAQLRPQPETGLNKVLANEMKRASRAVEAAILPDLAVTAIYPDIGKARQAGSVVQRTNACQKRAGRRCQRSRAAFRVFP